MITENLLRDFFGLPPERPRREPPKTTDKPNFKLFFFQLLHAYGELSHVEPLAWEKTLRHKDSGKTYKITVTMEQVDG